MHMAQEQDHQQDACRHAKEHRPETQKTRCDLPRTAQALLKRCFDA